MQPVDYQDQVLKKIDQDITDSNQAILELKESTQDQIKGTTMKYGRSRWDYEVNRGLERGCYHYDSSRQDRLEDVLHFHGNVDMDYQYFIDTYGSAALDNPVHWASRNKSVGGNYGIDQEVYDITRAGGDPESPIYGRANMFTDPKALKVSEGLLGLYDSELKLHTQICGQLLHLHMDNFAARLDRKNSFVEMDYDRDPSLVHRFVIFLNDWSMGQLWVQGTAVFTHWKAGDIISWEWQDIPHGTANLGWWPRYILQFTGRTTAKTLDFVKNTNRSSQHRIDLHR
jgi:hypothetical protein